MGGTETGWAARRGAPLLYEPREGGEKCQEGGVRAPVWLSRPTTGE